MGLLLGDILDQMESVVDGDTQPKLSLYSAHDSSVEVFLSMFGIWDQLWPKYAAYILFELFDVNGALYVRVVYNGEQMSLPDCLDTPEWQACTFNKFTAMAQSLIPTTEQCSAQCRI
ncbi:hypothetical protein Pelo_6659 [Pelomyxa schiedti]|nr:hypothetical protein Pelo_6659 [Pelomyxa schiedti]